MLQGNIITSNVGVWMEDNTCGLDERHTFTARQSRAQYRSVAIVYDVSAYPLSPQGLGVREGWSQADRSQPRGGCAKSRRV